MLFRRRKPATWRNRVREFFWPRKGLGRSVRYLGKRILRLSASPHAVAIGVAAGTFSAFTPFLGLHVILAVALAYALAGNLVAGWQMARSLLVAEDLLAKGEDAAFMEAKIATARFYAEHILAKAPGVRDAIVEGGESVTALALESF